MNILFFGSDECKKCLAAMKQIQEKELDKLSYHFLYVDAFDDDRQELCDEHGVDDLPHVKVFSDGKLAYESIGSCSVEKIIKVYAEEQNKMKKFNLSKRRGKLADDPTE